MFRDGSNLIQFGISAECHLLVGAAGGAIAQSRHDFEDAFTCRSTSGSRRGFYAASLKTELILIGGRRVQLQALIAGEIDFGTLNADGVILVNEKGANLKVIAGMVAAARYFGRRQSIQKDRGSQRRALGRVRIARGRDFHFDGLSEEQGLLSTRDTSVISGGTAARLTALESGAIAASILGIPYSDIAIDQGFNKLGDTMEVISTYQFNGITVNPAWAEKNRATVVKFLKAHIRSLRWIRETAPAGRGIFYCEMGVKPPYARRASTTLRRTRFCGWRGDPRWTQGQHRSPISRRYPEGTAAAPEKYADQSYVRQAQKELGL